MNTEARTRLYTVAVAIAALLVAGAAALLEPVILDTSRLWLLPTMVLLIALAGRFPFKVSPQGDASLFTVPLFVSVVMLPPLGVVLVGALGSLISERLLKAPIKVTTFNVSNSATAGGIAAIVFFMLRPEASGLSLTPGLVFAAAVAGMVLHLGNLSLLLGMITLIKGKAFWGMWRRAWSIDAIQEGALIALGLVAALVMDQAGWGIILLLVPFVLGYYGFRRSVEEARRKAELAEELQEKLKELKEAQVQLIQSAKLASVGTLAAGVAHEINNPTFAITGKAEIFLAMLRRADDEYLHSPAAIKDMETVVREGMRISSIVKHLLDFSRRSDDVSDLRLDEIIDDAAELMNGKFTKKGIQLVLDCQGTPKVRVVTNQLQQVFMNLLDNALDATPGWGTITMGCSVKDGTAMAYVKDTGVGIPEDVKDHIFDPFFTTRSVGKGTGLGLFICHKILEDHHGELSVESEPGAGTTFWVKLPAAKEISAEKRPESAAVAAS